MIFSILFNYFFARLLCLDKVTWRKSLLTFAVGTNLAFLIYYKYAGFIFSEFLRFFPTTSLSGNEFTGIILPIGISFYTFQGLSAVVDAYRREFETPPTLIDFGMYLSAFPQLIAGPIVRYVEVKDHITDRPISINQVFDGCIRFCFGLAKKVLLADTFAKVADSIFKLPENELTTSLAWFGVFTYAFQIYFDFSAYSDMGIGIGRAMGFSFPENFNNPYRAQSVTDFWRRWHMTLSRWFRDYLYIPLGGNRYSAGRTYFNLFTVFILCGLWHGASYNFLLWGLFHGALLSLERIMQKEFGVAPRGFIGQFLTFILVLIGWAIFRCDNLSSLKIFLGNMFSLNFSVDLNVAITKLLTADVLFLYFIAIMYVVFAGQKLMINRLLKRTWLESLIAVILLIISSASIIGNDFHPFIYFRF